MPGMLLMSYRRISAVSASAVMSVTKMRSRSVAPPSSAMKLTEVPPIHFPAGSFESRFSSAASSRIRPFLIMSDTAEMECMPVQDMLVFLADWLVQHGRQIVRSNVQVLLEKRVNFFGAFLHV